MIFKQKQNIRHIVVVITTAMCFSCNSNFNQVQKLGISDNEPIGVAEHINLKHTDSGRVTANLISDKMLDYSNRDFPYSEFPEGITLYLYNENNEQSTIISNYAISYENTKLIDLQGNVKVITTTNDTLFSEQLYYDQSKEWVYTNSPVTFKKESDIIHGNGFDSNAQFTNAEVLEVRGYLTVNE